MRCSGLYGVVLVLCAALDSVRLAESVEDLLRELRTDVGSVTVTCTDVSPTCAYLYCSVT